MKGKSKPVSKGEAAERICNNLDGRKLKSGASFVALRILFKANEHGEAWVTAKEIGQEHLMRESTVRAHLRALEAAGIVWRIDWTPGLRALATHDPRTGSRMRVPNWKPLYLVKDYARRRTIDLWRAYTDAPVHGRPPLSVERSAPAANDTPDVAPTESAPPPPAVETAPSPSEPARPGRALYEQLREAARHVAELGDSDDLIAEFCDRLSLNRVDASEIPAFVRALGRPASWWWRNRSPRKGETAPGYVTLQDLATFRVQGATRHTWKRWNDLLAHVRAARPSAPAALAPSSPPTSTPVTIAPTAPSSAPPPVTIAPSSPPAAETSTPRQFRTAEDLAALDVVALGAFVFGEFQKAPGVVSCPGVLTNTHRRVGQIARTLGWSGFDVQLVVWHWRQWREGALLRLQGHPQCGPLGAESLTAAQGRAEQQAAARWWGELAPTTRDAFLSRSLATAHREDAVAVAQRLTPLPRLGDLREILEAARGARLSPSATPQRSTVSPEERGEPVTPVDLVEPVTPVDLVARGEPRGPAEPPADLAGPTRAEPAPGVSKAPTGS